jgi:hypothetical protein
MNVLSTGKWISLAFIVLFFCTTNIAQSKAVNSSDSTSITVYNQNRALIKEKRAFELEKGFNHIDWNNLASTIDIPSVSLRSLSADKAIEVKEQSYKNDLINISSVLNRSIGKTVYLKHFLSDGRTIQQSGILLGSSSADERVVKIEGRYILKPEGQIEVSEIPAGLVAEPQLSFVVKALEGGKRDLLLAYETSNINWQCDYNLLLDDSQDKFDLIGWVTLNNQCGLNFKNAKLKLIAGNVHANKVVPIAMARQTYASADALNSAEVQEQAFADYHLYTLPEPIDINNNETKRLTLVERKAIPAIKKYVFDQQYYAYTPNKQKTPVQIKLEFQNDERNKRPLPGGQVRVYEEDADAEAQLIGEDRIMHTPVGEKITIKLGEAFDVIGERVRTSSEQTSAHRRKDTYKVTLNNHLEKDIVVTDIEHVPDIALFIADARYDKINSNTYEFEVKVPANESAEINYSVEIKN